MLKANVLPLLKAEQPENLFDVYFKYVDRTEAPLVFHRWSLLSCLGAYLGRQYWFPFGEFRIFPNMYVMLMGDPGTRKSSAIKMAKRILASTGYETFSAERTSKEKFLLDLEGLEDENGKIINSNDAMKNLFGEEVTGGEPREVFVCADEFNEFVGSGNLEFLSLLGSLWDWDDENKPFKQRLKTSRSVNIWQPTISILGGNTHSGFAEAFPPQSIGQGFLSRLILVHGEASGKKITFPAAPPESLKSQLSDMFMAIKQKVHGEAKMTDKAKGMLETIYRTYEGIDDVRFKHYSTRRFTHLLKLCLLCSAARVSTEIGAHDVLLANSLLSFTEHRMPQAMGEFGKSKNADVAGRLIAILAEAKQPIDIPDLWKHVSADLDKMEDLGKIMAGLLQAKKVQWATGAKGTAKGYLIMRKVLGNNQVYVDYSLIQESGFSGLEKYK